jgi:hypothetical protein
MPTASPTVPSTDIPARLDCLSWSRFHWLLVISLGTAVATGAPTLFGYPSGTLIMVVAAAAVEWFLGMDTEQ